MLKNKIYCFIFFIFVLLANPRLTFSQDIVRGELLLKRNQIWHQVKKLMGEKKHNEVIIKCKHLIEKDITFVGLFPLLAQSSKKMGVLDSTITFVKKLIAKEPESAHLLYGLAQCYKIQGNTQKTIDIFKQAININNKAFLIYLKLVFIARTKEQITDLIDYFKAKTRINPDNSFFYYGLGSIDEFKLKKYDSAFKYYHQALKIARNNGSKANEAKHLNTIGCFYWGRGKITKALDYFKLAAPAALAGGDQNREALFLQNCGLMYCHLGNWPKAKDYYINALKISKETGNKYQEAKMLRSIGFCFHRLSDYSQALGYYNQALQISQTFFDKNGESLYLADIARVYWVRGHYSKAIEYQKKALIIAQELGNKYNESSILDGIGSTYWKTGHYSNALEYYQRALKLSKNLGNKTLEANYLGNMGNVYRQIGKYEKALECCRMSLKIQREVGSKDSIGVNLSNIGSIYLDLDNSSQALKYYQRALKTAQELGNRKAEAIRLINIANTHYHLDQSSQALKCLKKSSKIAKEIGGKPIETIVFKGFGYLYYKLKDYIKSIHAFRSALVLAQNSGLMWESWESLYGLGLVYEKQEKYHDALTQYKKSIQFVEDVRSRFSMREHRASFLKRNIEVYESLIYLLFKLHLKQPLKRYDKEVFYYMEKAKARAFLDSLQEVKINLKESLSLDLLYEENKISKDISNIQTKLVKPGLSESERKELFQKLEEKEENYFNLIQKIKKENPEYANLVYPEPQKLKTIQENLLDEKTALMEYFIGEESSLLFFITRDHFSIHKLSEGKKIQDMVEDYIDLLANIEVKKFRAFAAGKKIYQELIDPVKDKLVNFNKVIIVPDGNLHYLPFEALVVPSSSSKNRFLVEDLHISYGPSASSLLNLKKRKRELNLKKDFLAFADPLYTLYKKPEHEKKADWFLREFCLKQGFDLSPLKYSGEEVKKIARLIKKQNRVIYTRQDAKEEILKEISLSDFRIIHFATHGLFDEKAPQRSSLVLTLDEDPREDGFFQVREIYNSKLNSDLVVLSACQTGKGKLEKGEGVSGLSRAFLYAGAQAVLVSLWNVNDKATSIFMEYFYKYLVAGKSLKEALQKAKKKMIKSRYNHPFYWAGFVLIGESKSSIKLK